MWIKSTSIRAAILLLAALFCLQGGLQLEAQIASIYTNMIGDWIGFDDTTLNGSLQHIPVRLHIAQTENKDAVRMDYTYSEPGKDNFSTASKCMMLKPEKSEMVLRWKGLLRSSEKYKAHGLDEFARTGSGGFIATGTAVGPGGGGDSLFSFELAPNALSYKWMNKTRGGGYYVMSSFSLKRVTPPQPNPSMKSDQLLKEE